jgi:hypothetical protein
MSQGAQALTDISITGDLNVFTGQGGVVGGVSQVAGSALTILGKATFTADTVVAQQASLNSATNKLNAVAFKTANGGSWHDVTVLTTEGLKLSSDGPLTIREIKTGGDSEIITLGKVDLGTAIFGGKLKINSGGFEIMQSGPGNFGGDVDFDAGTAKIDLFNPLNRWKGSIVYKGGIIMINHPQLLNATNAGTLMVRVETTMAMAAPVAKVAAASSNATSSEPSLLTKGSDISISVNRAPSAGQSGLVTVTVSSEIASTGKSFAFALNDHIPAEAAKSTQISVSQIDGKPLPEWLRYEPATQKVVATSPPPGAFPIQIRANLGGVETVIVITEQPK